MKVLFITTMSARGYMVSGRTMLSSMKAMLGEGISLRLYAEGFVPDPDVLPAGAAVMDLDAAAPWLADFKACCDLDPARCGKIAGGGYNMRWDARRFSHKVAAFGHAALDPEAQAFDVLGWMDADLIAHEPIDVAWLAELFPPPAYLAWLDRRNNYPECGFFLCRPCHPAHRKVWQDVLALYTDRTLFNHAEWHDSYLIQQVIDRAVAEGVLTVHSLSGAAGFRTSHPLVNGRLGERLEHLKGPRKEAGRSFARDLRVVRTEKWWTGRK